MIRNPSTTLDTSQTSVLVTNKVIRNTYILLSLSLLFSAAMAGVSMVLNVPPMGFLTILVYFGLLMLVNTFRNSSIGILCVFALTGFLGFTLGPILNSVIRGYANGSQIVLTSLGGTGVIFMTLSAYALKTRTNFNYLGGFLSCVAMVLFITMIVGLFVHIPAIHLFMSAAAMLFASGIILYETSNIIHNGETNYIMATVSLYLAIYNMFISLIQILSALSGRNE